MKERLLDPASTLVRISLDSGGSFMKVVINVFNPEQERSTENYNNSGVQRSQILAISEDIPESNYNLRIILDRLNLQDVKFSIAFDLKCGNAVFGISSHAGKRACLFCEGTAGTESGKLRSLGSLDYWYQEYAKTGFNKAKMQNFMNVINPRILYLEEDPDLLVQELVPPPELHLPIGVVSLLGGMIFDLWPEFDDWLNEKNILQRGYQGRGWDGNNSNSILSYLDDLEAKIMQASPHLLPFVQCLKDFRAIKDACFGNDLNPEFGHYISKFKNSFLCCQDLAFTLNTKLSITWKVHIVMAHVAPFVQLHNCGLARYAEQVGESIHAKFKPTWGRYKRSEGHSEHGNRLFSAVKNFGSRRIK